MKAVISFLGYIPFEYDEKETIGVRLKMSRQIAGLSHRQLGKQIGVDPSTLSLVENEKRTPLQRTIDKCKIFISEHLSNA